MPLFFNEEVKIDFISGPVSMYVLNPTDSFLTRNPYAPVFILFGDWHGDSNGFCPSTGNDNDDFVQFSCKVFSLIFLKLLSDLVKKKEGMTEEKEDKEEKDGLVNFYIESGHAHITPYTPTNQEPLLQLWGWMSKCYNNIRMAPTIEQTQLRSNCDTYMKNIRWQAGDVRYFYKVQKKIYIWDFLVKFVNKFNTLEKTENNFTLLLNIEIDIYVQEHWKIVLENIITPDPEQLCKSYLDEDIIPIRKQLEKISDENLKASLLQRFKDYIYYIDNKDSDDTKRSMNTIHSVIIDLIKSERLTQSRIENVQSLWKHFTSGQLMQYNSFLLARLAIMTDLYTIARSYKTMCKLTNESPLINVLYFGAYHTENIASFLTKEYSYKSEEKIRDYDLLYESRLPPGYTSNPSSNINRCLNIRQDIHLNQLIDRLKKARQKHLEK